MVVEFQWDNLKFSTELWEGGDNNCIAFQSESLNTNGNSKIKTYGQHLKQT